MPQPEKTLTHAHKKPQAIIHMDSVECINFSISGFMTKAYNMTAIYPELFLLIEVAHKHS